MRLVTGLSSIKVAMPARAFHICTSICLADVRSNGRQADVTRLILFEDADLLVVHKPSGVNTHKPDPFAPDGIHEWLGKRGYKLSILHRLDKETSGVLVFGKSTRANQSLAKQFEKHKVRKEYLFLSAQRPKRQRFCEEWPNEATWFEYLEPVGENHLIKAEPVTGKTHQIRRHAKIVKFPVLGDTQYGDMPAPRLMLHAHRITLTHPATGAPVTFEASVPAVFEDLDPLTAAREFRELIYDAADTNAYRLVNAAGDSLPDIIIDSYADRQFCQRLAPTAVLPLTFVRPGVEGGEVLVWAEERSRVYAADLGTAWPPSVDADYCPGTTFHNMHFGTQEGGSDTAAANFWQ